MKYKEITFLLWKHAETPLNRSIQEIKNSIDRLKTEKSQKEVLPLIYTSIEKTTFDDETEWTQEFIFYPEMNRPRKQKPGGQK